MTKDQMHFHTSDLDRNFKFTPILDKKPQKTLPTFSFISENQ